MIATIFVILVVIVIGLMSVYKHTFQRSDIDKSRIIPNDTIIIIQDKPFYTNVQSTYKCNRRV